MKQVIIVHGYKSSPESAWKPWLKSELESAGFIVKNLRMPNPQHPVMSEWVAEVTRAAGRPTSDIYLVGHSLGGMTILRYLETLNGEARVGGAILVGSFIDRFTGYTEGSHDSFFESALEWQTIKEHCDKFVIIQSIESMKIDLAQLDILRHNLDAKVITTRGEGHFSSADNVFEVPRIRDELIKIAK